jgi:pilus assembly protein Flp/PilA
MRTPDLQTFLRRFARDESGSNALEYGLIVGFVSLAIVAGATAAGKALGTMFTDIGTAIGTVSASITATTG